MGERPEGESGRAIGIRGPGPGPGRPGPAAPGAGRGLTGLAERHVRGATPCLDLSMRVQSAQPSSYSCRRRIRSPALSSSSSSIEGLKSSWTRCTVFLAPSAAAPLAVDSVGLPGAGPGDLLPAAAAAAIPAAPTAPTKAALSASETIELLTRRASGRGDGLGPVAGAGFKLKAGGALAGGPLEVPGAEGGSSD